MASLPQRLFDIVYFSCTDANRDFNLQFFYSYLVGLSAFVVANAPFVILDLLNPAFIHPYRVQNPDRKLTLADIKKSFPKIFVNLICIHLVIGYTSYLGDAYDITRELPGLTETIVTIVAFAAIEEVFYYYTHSFFHLPFIYKHIHKVHHSYTAPFSLTSVYAHPVEHIFNNMLPSFAGTLFMKTHVSIVWLWMFLVIGGTTITHSGYHLPFMKSSEFHDFHHESFNECFGVFGIMDYLHGTSKKFRAGIRGKRNVVLLSTTPARELYPEEKKKE